MIKGNLDSWQQAVANPSQSLAIAFGAMTEFASNTPEPGWYLIDGEDVKISVQTYTTKDFAACKFEAHEKYIDIQYIVSGKERMGVLPLDAGLEIMQPYNPEKDCILYKCPPENQAGLHALDTGEFMVLYPEDAHMPGYNPAEGSTEIVKLVAKVRV